VQRCPFFQPLTRYFLWKGKTVLDRLSQPSEKTADYEVGKFEYFDRGTREGWCTRLSSSFRFEAEEMGK
jgi:CCR4-NOT transcriptional regulation complex NOT5 subunit